MKTQQLDRNPPDDEGYRKSSWSPKNAVIRYCVSVRIAPEAVTVRDTKDPSETTLSYSHAEWEAFIRGVKVGEFDLPTS